MGHGRLICVRVRYASSARCKACLLTAGAEVASKVCGIGARIIDRFCNIILGKTAYYENIPLSVVCIFAQYMGYSFADGQAKLKSCFVEYREVADKSSLDHLCHHHFDKKSVVSQQLHAIAFEFGRFHYTQHHIYVKKAVIEETS